MGSSRKLVLLLLLGGCTRQGTAVLLTLEGTGSIDAVEVVGSWDGSDLHRGQTMGHAMPLPVQVLVKLPDRALQARFTVAASLSGQVVGQGATGTLSVVPHHYASVEVPLTPPGGDLATGDAGELGAADFAGADLTGVDLAGADLAAMDLSMGPDLRSVDLGPCTGPSLCVDGGTQPCTGFEGSQIDPPFYKLERTGCVVEEDSTHVCRGQKALHVHLPAASSGMLEAIVFEQALVPASTFYARAFYYFAADPTDPSYLMQAYQQNSPYEAVTLVEYENGQLEQQSSCGATNVASAVKSTLHFPLNKWVCVEWKIVSGTSMNGSATVSVDGTPVSEIALANANTQSSPPLDTVGFGLTASPTSSVGAADAWVDEIEVDTSPIGCAR
jgi:hypothetical protein